jgi:sigma-B regulation protein RsbQ
MSIIHRNNVRILGNQQSDKTLVFAHGFGTDQTAWNQLVPAFEETYRIVLFDYVGANEATTPFFNPRKYNQLHAYAEDMLDIFEELNLKDVIFIGHSAGGMSGILAAIQEPNWFSRLVLLNASPHYLNAETYNGGFSVDILEHLFGQMESNFHAWVSGFAPMIMANPNRPQLANSFAKTLSGMRPDVALAIARTIFYSDHRSDLAHLLHPTLLIQAKEDVAVPLEVGYFMQRQIPNSTLFFVDTEGHLPHVSNPELVLELIKPFIVDSSGAIYAANCLP